jgi:hypothetical protein
MISVCPALWLASQRVTAPGEPFGLEVKTKSKDANHSYNPTFSKATRKDSVRDMDNVIKGEPTEGGCGK